MRRVLDFIFVLNFKIRGFIMKENGYQYLFTKSAFQTKGQVFNQFEKCLTLINACVNLTKIVLFL